MGIAKNLQLRAKPLTVWHLKWSSFHRNRSADICLLMGRWAILSLRYLNGFNSPSDPFTFPDFERKTSRLFAGISMHVFVGSAAEGRAAIPATNLRGPVAKNTNRVSSRRNRHFPELETKKNFRGRKWRTKIQSSKVFRVKLSCWFLFTLKIIQRYQRKKRTTSKWHHFLLLSNSVALTQGNFANANVLATSA